jgi:hypothetical protein
VRATNQNGAFDDAAIESANTLASCSARAIYNAQLFWEARLAARTREQLLSASSQDLLGLAANMEQRVNDLRARVSRTPGRASPDAVNRGLADIEGVAAAIGQRIQDLQLLASDHVGV